MRALVIGRGSMGRRRIRDLTALGVEVESWDPPTEELHADHLFDLFVVSTPPLTHRNFFGGRDFLFTEADVESIPSRHFPSATPLFTEWWPRLRDGPAAQATEYWQWTGQHIEDWHPGADPATYYALRDPTLAIREMVAFELIWLTKLYGPLVQYDWQKDRWRWSVHTKHRDGASGLIIIDICSRPAVRRFTFDDTTVELRYTESDYLAEMRALVAAVKGEQPWPYTQAEEAANIEVLRTIERF